jgi:hypothetical protein
MDLFRSLIAWIVALLLVLIGIGARYVEWWLFVLILAVWVWAFIGSPELRNSLKWNNALVTGTFILQVVLLGDTVWLPGEVISQTKASAVVGYVLNDGPQWTVVLKDEDRTVQLLPSLAVEARRICLPPGASEVSSLTDLIFSRPNKYPDCDVAQGEERISGRS